MTGFRRFSKRFMYCSLDESGLSIVGIMQVISNTVPMIDWLKINQEGDAINNTHGHNYSLVI